jgi:predicted exporter
VTVARGGAVALWIVGLIACIAIIARTRLSTDMSAFLPRSPSPAQQVLVDQVQNGVVSRLILVAVDGAPEAALAALSKEMGKHLRAAPEIGLVANGEEVGLDQERDFIWRHRYVLSRAVTPEHFTAASLRQALENDLQLLRSDMGLLVKRSLPNDPTGEILLLLGQFAGDARPPSRDGVWFSGDGKRAMLLVQTRAAGFDIDAQQRALELIGAAFDGARQALPQAGTARLLETGPAVFAVRTRATMKHDASYFSAIATVLVAGVLLLAYRSPRLLLLSFLPVGSGALAGIAAVGLGFGFVHGITLGFGVTLIGEAVDYAIYLFTQTTPGSAPETTLPRIWPTLRLGVLTSIFGFSAMLFSSFSGFAQLGLFSIAGLVAAVSVTRWVLPVLVPGDLAATSTILAPAVRAVVRHARRLRLPLLSLVIIAAAVLSLHRHGFWAEEISSLSPIPAADQKLDQELRRDTGAPDVRYLLVAAAADEQRALGAAERLAGVLDRLVADKALASFDAPDRYLPSDAAQRARLDALPSDAALRESLQQALEGLPFRPDLFAPFLEDVAAAKLEKPIARGDLPPALSLKLDSLLFERGGRSVAMLPLRGVADAEAVRRAVAALADADIVFVDLKGESDTLLQTYQHEAIVLALMGGLVITVLLSAALRSVRRVWLVLAPLAAAVIVTASALTAGDEKLSIFNLVGLLLVVAVGSNYSLFFERESGADQQGDRTVASLVLANTCTVIGFGVLSFSSMAVLHDIGLTVAVGTFLSLVFAAILSTGYAGGPTRHRDIRP